MQLSHSVRASPTPTFTNEAANITELPWYYGELGSRNAPGKRGMLPGAETIVNAEFKC